MRLFRWGGFTLAEIVIVAIIVCILTVLALPRYKEAMEYAKGIEALIQLGILRQSLHRSYLSKKTFEGVALDDLDVDNPQNTPRSRFNYSIISNKTQFILAARRNTFDKGDGFSTIQSDQDGIKSGTGLWGQHKPGIKFALWDRLFKVFYKDNKSAR